jgi:hypothetical protein
VAPGCGSSAGTQRRIVFVLFYTILLTLIYEKEGERGIRGGKGEGVRNIELFE